MKYYLIQDGCGGENLIRAEYMSKVDDLSKEMIEAALKFGYSEEDAEIYRWKIVREIEIICPVCEKHVFEYWGDYDICPVCGWYNDGIQYTDHNYEGGCNKKSVNQLKKEVHKT